jgi:hypothetical protein
MKLSPLGGIAVNFGESFAAASGVFVRQHVRRLRLKSEISLIPSVEVSELVGAEVVVQEIGARRRQLARHGRLRAEQIEADRAFR